MPNMWKPSAPYTNDSSAKMQTALGSRLNNFKNIQQLIDLNNKMMLQLASMRRKNLSDSTISDDIEGLFAS